MIKIVIFFILIIAIFAVPNFESLKQQGINVHTRITSPTRTPSLDSDPSLVQVFAKNLDIPWAIGFLPDGSMIVTQRQGSLLQIDKAGNSKGTARINVKAIGEGGLLGLAVSPSFSSDNFIYIYYTYAGSSSNVLNRVSRFEFKNGKLTGEKILVDNIPAASNHDGGRIKFGPDGYLYVATGDAQEPSRAQDKNSLSGKILRITKDGKAVPGNPFGTFVYSYGHRNPQGLAWDSSGRLWATEHGRSAPTGYDELNIIESGKNYGWPEIQGNESKAGMVTPIINSGPSTTWAPAGTIFLNDSIFFAGLKGEALYEYNIVQKKLTEHFKGQYGRLRDVVLGPDGYIYVTTSNLDGRGTPARQDDQIIKINPSNLFKP